jgi:crotonobetainyl-CoA:carnitine CoA-transferase CaiB-like acyl-CoA transferase
MSSVDDTAGTGPLDGIRVVELAVWVAGPAAAGIMADWGADVIKVEPATGDPQRSVFGAIGVRGDIPVPPFEIDNRGKRSIVLDLRGDDLAHFHALLAKADVLVTNMRPGALERLGLGHDEICRRYPHLVYGSITGYGLEGDERDRAGYDVGAFWARSGLAHTMVPAGELPPGLRSGMGDHQTGMTLAAGVMAKLVDRVRTGQGGLVTTSLLRTGMYSIGWDIGIHLRFGRRQSTRPRDRHPAPLVNSYRAGDDRAFWLICLEADRHWPKMLAAIERPDLADDDRFATAQLRNEHCEPLIAELDAVFLTRPLGEWGERFDEHDVWWAPIQSIAELIDDPQAQGGFVEMAPNDGGEPYRSVATPVDFDGHVQRPGPVPHLGEHTADVLAELTDQD